MAIQHESPREHPYFPRWSVMNNRCLNPNSADYQYYGQRGITICAEWHRDNPNGFYNFLVWLETQLKLRSEVAPFVVGRRDVKKGFGPENCELQTRTTSNQHKRKGLLTGAIVIQARKLVREQPDLRIKDLQAIFGFGSDATWSSALLGRTWQNVNETEPPIAPRESLRGLQYARIARNETTLEVTTQQTSHD
jgi:hypothetical protein